MLSDVRTGAHARMFKCMIFTACVKHVNDHEGLCVGWTTHNCIRYTNSSQRHRTIKDKQKVCKVKTVRV